MNVVNHDFERIISESLMKLYAYSNNIDYHFTESDHEDLLSLVTSLRMNIFMKKANSSRFFEAHSLMIDMKHIIDSLLILIKAEQITQAVKVRILLFNYLIM